jgi:hypothetical protein
VPLFIKGGRIIFQQSDLTDVRATKDLNNNFKLICALEPSAQKSLSSASGFLTLLNNFDDEGVIGNCIKNNCVMGISVFAKNLFFF